MNWKNVRYRLWICPLIFASAIFYSIVVLAGVKQIIQLDDEYRWPIQIVTFVAISFYGLWFDAPRIRDVWNGEVMDEKYTSLRGSWAGIVIGATTGTIIFMSQVEAIEILNQVQHWQVAVIVFIVFMLIMVCFIFCPRWARRRR
ncbi:hypothetical protein [Pseudomonas sp. dw_612]|uniref:hypothetical protein n=1 Tax=Pseudomonas sp. dw_612 TaxID=2720080 RepID=UPI001BD52292|nr:hypothetical protein [Pseudomonas sp. dw_612]